jgi:hypothetical protein
VTRGARGRGSRGYGRGWGSRVRVSSVTRVSAVAYIDGVAPLLAEELVVLGRSSTGKSLILPGKLDRGVAGALLAELAAAGRIGYAGGVVRVTDGTATGRPVLDMVLQQVARRHRTPRAWVSRLASQELVRQVRVPSRIWGPRREELVARLSGGLTTQARPGPRTAALAALVAACGLSGKLFPGVDRQVRKRRLAEISAGQWPASAVRASVRAAVARLPFQILWAIGDLFP